MQRKIHDRLFFLAFFLLAPTICYWMGERYAVAAGGKNPPNCNNCPCKNVTAWQVATDPANQAHDYQQQTQANPPAYKSILTAQLNISTIPNSCVNNTGNTNQANGTFASWTYVNASPVCANGQLPQEMSVSDVGTWVQNVGNVLVCAVP